MNELTKDSYMTITEVSEVLGVTQEAIRKHVRSLFPEIMEHGKITRLTEPQITEIKRNMQQSTQVVSAVTRIDKAEAERLELHLVDID